MPCLVCPSPSSPHKQNPTSTPQAPPTTIPTAQPTTPCTPLNGTCVFDPANNTCCQGLSCGPFGPPGPGMTFACQVPPPPPPPVIPFWGIVSELLGTRIVNCTALGTFCIRAVAMNIWRCMCPLFFSSFVCSPYHTHARQQHTGAPAKGNCTDTGATNIAYPTGMWRAGSKYVPFLSFWGRGKGGKVGVCWFGFNTMTPRPSSFPPQQKFTFQSADYKPSAR